MNYAVLPDQERWPNEYVQLVFDGEPTAEVPHLRGLSVAERRRYAGAHLAPVALAMGSVHCIACCMLHVVLCMWHAAEMGTDATGDRPPGTGAAGVRGCGLPYLLLLHIYLSARVLIR